MSKYEVEVYIEGVQVVLSWHDERILARTENFSRSSTIFRNHSASKTPTISNGIV